MFDNEKLEELKSLSNIELMRRVCYLEKLLSKAVYHWKSEVNEALGWVVYYDVNEVGNDSFVEHVCNALNITEEEFMDMNLL